MPISIACIHVAGRGQGNKAALHILSFELSLKHTEKHSKNASYTAWLQYLQGFYDIEPEKTAKLIFIVTGTFHRFNFRNHHADDDRCTVETCLLKVTLFLRMYIDFIFWSFEKAVYFNRVFKNTLFH